jgi:hypothetical protein
LTYALFPGQSTPSNDLLTLLTRQARWDDEAGQLNSSGLKLRFEKIDEQTMPGGRVDARYRIYAEGAPENKVFSFGTWATGKALGYDSRDIYVNGQGLLMLRRPKPEQETSFRAPGDEFEVMPPTDAAEPMRFIFASMDGQFEITATLVPHPVASVEQGCRIEVKTAQPDVSAVLIVVDGFPAREKVPVVLKSENASVSQVLDTDVNGHAVMGAFPYLPGKTHGMLKASAEGPGCLPSVTLPWGPATPAAAKNP